MSQPPKVVLVNARGSQSHIYIDAASSLVGFDVIAQALREEGLPAPALFPERLTAAFPPAHFNEEELAQALMGVASGASNLVFAVSTTTDDYSKFAALCRLIARRFPNALRVGGGPHFQRESLTQSGAPLKDPVETALTDGLIHAAVCGHAKPFASFVRMLARGKARVEKGRLNLSGEPPAGLYWLEGNEVMGHGAGRYPRLSDVPLALDSLAGSFGPRANILVNDTCSNRCDFCSVLRSSPRFEESPATESLASKAAEMGLAHINFVDSNPLEGRKLAFYRGLLSGLRAKKLDPTKSLFVDPSLIASYGEELLAFMEEHRVSELFTGREVVTAEVAEKIGVRYQGKLKGAERIAQEKLGLERLIHALKERPGPGGQVWSVLISYILTPFETGESALATIEEMAAFQAMSGPNVEVICQFTLLCPYPGTKLRARMVEAIEGPDNYLNYSCMSNVWKYELGRAVHFLDAVRFHAKFQLYSPQVIYRSMKEQAERVFGGPEPAPLPLKEKRAFIHSLSQSMGGPFIWQYGDYCRLSRDVPY